MHARTVFEMELIIFIGLQASGKSTYFHTHFAATHEYVSKVMSASQTTLNMKSSRNRYEPEIHINRGTLSGPPLPGADEGNR